MTELRGSNNRGCGFQRTSSLRPQPSNRTEHDEDQPDRGPATSSRLVEDRSDHGVDALQQTSTQLLVAANANPVLSSVYTTFRIDAPQLVVDVDRQKASSLDAPLQNVFNAMQISNRCGLACSPSPRRQGRCARRFVADNDASAELGTHAPGRGKSSSDGILHIVVPLRFAPRSVVDPLTDEHDVCSIVRPVEVSPQQSVDLGADSLRVGRRIPEDLIIVFRLHFHQQHVDHHIG
jgi:hypothetical protein